MKIPPLTSGCLDNEIKSTKRHGVLGELHLALEINSEATDNGGAAYMSKPNDIATSDSSILQNIEYAIH